MPPEPWAGVRDATAFGPTAKIAQPGQLTDIPEPAIDGDDVLTVNVTTPDPSASLPVLVWIHGGGFVEGSPTSPWYDGRSFAAGGVVLVTVGYRLGFEGFGHLPDTIDNRGAHDWLAALRWLRDSISAFGGDPDRVTIGGQSAGGSAVLGLLASPAAQPLFHQVLACSPAPIGISRESAARTRDGLARALGVPATRDGFASVPRRRVAELQSLIGGHALLQVRLVLAEGLFFGPVVDDDLITADVPAALAAGSGADKPVLVGATTDEFSAQFARLPRAAAALPAGAYLAALGIPRERRHAFRAGLPDSEREATSSVDQAAAYLNASIFHSWVTGTADARHTAEASHATDPLPTAGAGTWVYRFDWPTPRRRLRGRPLAVHCLDVPFLFNTLDDPHVTPLAGLAPPERLARSWHEAATEFITTGRAPWSPWDSGRRAIVLDDPVYETADPFPAARSLQR